VKFKIGDKVIIAGSGVQGTVADVLLSKGDGTLYYEVDGTFYSAEDLKTKDAEYRYDILMADPNVVVAVLYEKIGDEEHEIARGHGHIMHEGAVGYAQAASYAVKRILLKINDDKLVVNDDWKGNCYER
jgi:hypothetical protein